MFVELLPLLFFLTICVALMLGYPVAFTLMGVSFFCAGIGMGFGVFDGAYLSLIPNRLYGVLTNQNLIAIPLFIFMGTMLEKSNIAEALLKNMSLVFMGLPGGLGISTVVVGTLLAASTGIVGATVVAMGILSLPTMLRAGYKPSLAAGTICATGTLGQIIPPSICLVLLGEVVSNAFQQSQLNAGEFNGGFVSIGDLFAGALVPGMILVSIYALYLCCVGLVKPEFAPVIEADEKRAVKSTFFALIKGLFPPLFLMIVVLGSIVVGIATPTEAASVGAIGAVLLALLKRELTFEILKNVNLETLRVTSMVYLILIGAAIFSSVFRGFGGDIYIEELLVNLPGGVISAVLVVMLLIFILGFILDFIEITFMVIPVVGPVILSMGVDPIWFGVMIAINLQTSFLTPPFGFSLFYLRSVAPPELATIDIFKGVMPFVIFQIFLLVILAVFPGIVTWLPQALS
jgi:tripartite ATP-independent transporter DctM subunit